MSFRIYTQDNDGLHLVKSGATYAETEYYRQFCRNIVVRDSANDLPNPFPSDDELSEVYGVADSRVLESAAILFACMGGGALLLVGTLIYNAITGG